MNNFSLEGYPIAYVSNGQYTLGRETNEKYVKSLDLDYLTYETYRVDDPRLLIFEMSWFKDKYLKYKLVERLELGLPTAFRLLDCDPEQTCKDIGYQITFELIDTYQVPLITPCTPYYRFNGKIYHPDYFIPYHYIWDRCHNINDDRIPQVLVAGVVDKSYPVREYFCDTFKEDPIFKRLSHPGYEEPKKHTIVNTNFIDYAAQFKYMLVCPSIWDMFLLKFVECAEAGCVPVGKLPSYIGMNLKLPSKNRISNISAEEYREKLFTWIDEKFWSEIKKLLKDFNLDE